MAAVKNAACRNAQVSHLANLFNRLEIRAGGTVLVTLVIAGWGTASAGTIGATGVPVQAQAVASGTATLARLYHDANAEEVDNLSVTATAGGGDIELDNTSINVDQLVSLTQISLTTPANFA